MATWEVAGTARNDFADMIEGLTPEQLDEQSLCLEWNARGVLAHVTSFVETGFFGIMGTMIKSRFHFHKSSISMANLHL